MPSPKTGANHYHAQLRFLNKGMVVCYVVLLGSMKWMGLRTCASNKYILSSKESVKILQTNKPIEISILGYFI